GIGTQTMGSNQRPSAYCGVVGMKPTLGRISYHGVLPTSWNSDHIGISAREVADVALALHAVARHDSRDPLSLADPAHDYRETTSVQLRHIRLGVLQDLFERATPEVRSAAEDTVKKLREHGAEIVERRFPVAMELLLAMQFII